MFLCLAKTGGVSKPFSITFPMLRFLTIATCID
jgi:hypothetical protein